MSSHSCCANGLEVQKAGRILDLAQEGRQRGMVMCGLAASKPLQSEERLRPLGHFIRNHKNILIEETRNAFMKRA
jgi:hypothetical protein